MPLEPRPAKPKPGGRLEASPPLRVWILLAGLTALTACGKAEPTVAPEPAPPPTIHKAPAPRIPPGPPSTFSIVVDEAKRRQELIERLKRVLQESEP